MVYVVFAGERWGERSIEGIFSNLEAAKKFRAQLYKDEYPNGIVWIETHAVKG